MFRWLLNLSLFEYLRRRRVMLTFEIKFRNNYAKPIIGQIISEFRKFLFQKTGRGLFSWERPLSAFTFPIAASEHFSGESCSPDLKNS